MTEVERCYCRECRDLDANTPRYLEGVPGAWQARLFPRIAMPAGDEQPRPESIEDERPGPELMNDMFDAT